MMCINNFLVYPYSKACARWGMANIALHSIDFSCDLWILEFLVIIGRDQCNGD